MKATQIRVYLVVSAIAAVITLGPRMAHAQVCVNPANTAVTATSTNVTFKVGAVTASCTSAKATFTTPAAPNNCSPPAALPICVAATVSFTGCKATIGGISVPANLTPVNPWQLCLNTAGGASTASLVIPQNGLTATATVLGQNCTTKVAPTAPTTASGGWASPTATFTNASVPVVTSGGFPCPSATTASFSGTFTTSPAVTFP